MEKKTKKLIKTIGFAILLLAIGVITTIISHILIKFSPIGMVILGVILLFISAYSMANQSEQ